jgi:hypothetical protein
MKTRTRYRTLRLRFRVTTGLAATIFIPWSLSLWWTVAYIGTNKSLAMGRGYLSYASVSGSAATPGIRRNILGTEPGWKCWTNSTPLHSSASFFEGLRPPTYEVSNTGNPPLLTLVSSVIPLWIFFLFFVACSLFTGLNFLHYRRTEDFNCCHCQYDLRHNQSGICPECGSMIPAQQRVKLDCISIGAPPAA